MALKTYAAIEVGSKELVLKVYEIGKRIGIRQLDCVKYMLDLGSSAYSDKSIGYEQVNELCDVLKKFKLKLEEYRVDDYVAYGGSALKEADNGSLVLDQIKVRTGLKVSQMGNAQQRFLVFKSIAFKMENFEQLIKEGAIIIDLGSGSLQVSVFEAGTLQLSQNIRIGALRIREMLSSLEGHTSNFSNVIQEFVDNNIQAFRGADFKSRKIKHAIIVGEEFSSMIHY
ncbi:MAG: exopolyphosphatase, partial [Catenibacillus sp.]|nr:exopolyphosphatase [Catenibacillus sp.]